MKTVILEAFRDESTGELGLGVKGMPRDETTNAAADGLTIAHDLIEHVNGPQAIGTIDDELEALGAIWYVRGQHGELRRDRVGSVYTIEQNLANDVTRMFRDHVAGDQYVSYRVPRSRPCDADDDLIRILEAGDESYRGEFNEDEREGLAEKWAAYRAVALVRMRAGWRKAYRKWERLGRFAANNRFWEIAEAVDSGAKPQYEGQQFRLSYGLGGATCEEIYDEE